MDFNAIEFSRPEPGVGLLTLDRPDRLNAMSLEMLHDLSRLFAHLIGDDTVRVVIITGRGRGFCSGADLKDARVQEQAADLFPDAATHLFKIQKVFAQRIVELKNIPQPVIAAVNGPAAGGGMCLAMASDVILASPRATFTASFANIGLSGGELGSSYLLPRLVGAARAAEILLTGRTVDAEEAERIGLVGRVVEADELMDAALRTARLMKAKPLKALWLTKESLNFSQNAPSLKAAIEFENRTQSMLCFTKEFWEAVTGFGKK